jgi:hypothetical protein
MKLHVSNVWLIVDTSAVNDADPQTAQERITFVKDAISEVNMRLNARNLGISIEGFIEDGDIRVS